MSVQELVEYIRILLKRWWLFVIVCGTTLGALLVSFYAAPPQYEATVRFLVSTPPSADVTLYPSFSRPSESEQIAVRQAAFMELLESSTVAWRTVDALQVPIGGDELSARITVDQPMDSQFVWVSVLADEPQVAADLANTLVDMAKQHYGQLLAEPSASAREFISMQVQSAFQEFQAAKQALADFKRDHQVSDLPAEIASQRTIVWNLILERGDATVARQTAQVSAYDRLIAQHQAELQRLTALSDEYEGLQDDIRRAEANYGFLLDKETEAKLKENEVLRADFIQVVEPAHPPSKPVSPFNAKILAVAGVSSLIISTVVAFVLEYVESRRHREPQGEAVAGDSQS